MQMSIPSISIIILFRFFVVKVPIHSFISRWQTLFLYIDVENYSTDTTLGQLYAIGVFD